MRNNRKHKKIKVDYQAKNLQNPFYRAKNESKTGKWKLLAFLIFIIALIWFFLFSPIFIIKEIKIEGLSRVDKNEITSIIDNYINKEKTLFFSQNNLFLLNTDDLSALIIDKYNFSKLDILKKMPDTVILSISERPYAFIFSYNDKQYFASREGYIIKDEEVKDEDKSKYLILENQSDAVLIGAKNKIKLSDEYLNFVFTFNQELSKYENLSPNKYIIEQELNSLILEYQDGPTVLININKDPNIQAEDLYLVKTEKIRDNWNRVSYIDMRYGDRIYFN
jgi:cell division septal protein FtsQ